ncbi:unnamed protein product [Heterobilharzia americana]|nr:unnamed protein product [Heterobilharzia americana]
MLTQVCRSRSFYKVIQSNFPSYSRSTLTLNKQLPFEEFNQLLLDIEHEKDEDDNSDNSENEGDTNHNTNSHIPFENSTNNTQLTQHSTPMTSTVTTTVTENLNPSVHDHNNLTIIKNKTNIPAKSSSFNNQVKTSRPSNDFEKNNLQGRLSIQNANNNTQTQSSKLFSSKSIKGKLEIKFLLDQDDIIQDISKYGKVAKTIITKGGIPKLFVIRGRVIDTRIQFCQYFKSENVTTTSTTINDLNLLKNKKFRLRFKPFTSFGGICTPAIGYNDPMQIPNILLRQEQLCFIQAVQQENNVTYKKLDDGYLVMEIDLHSFCNIFHLVFPFLNSKCPSTWKKDVHITVTLIDENDTEFASAEFEVVSCASPIRDARRYQQRQHIAELEYAEKRLERTVCCDLPSDWDQSGQQTSKSSTKISISDISPNSSGFGSLYSPLPPSMTSEEDRVNELQIYLSRPDTSTPSHIFLM